MKKFWPLSQILKFSRLVFSNFHRSAILPLPYSSLYSQTNYSIPYGEEYVKAYMICANGKNSPCQYDQGSLMKQGKYVIGIMSRNNGCGSAGTFDLDPTTFTRLSAYYSWIVTTAGPHPVIIHV